MELYLFGEKNSKRAAYFAKAAAAQNTRVQIRNIADTDPCSIPPSWVKIDPISYQNYDLERMEELVFQYQERLLALKKSTHTFFNHPAALLSALDKLQCKRRLDAAKLTTTQMFDVTITDVPTLKQFMEGRYLPGVFIKPRYGSGAAGILAYRFHPKANREVLYTCAAIANGKLVNTRKLRRLDHSNEIRPILEKILAGQTLLERWHPKAKWKQESYDLRAIMQFGTLDFLIARRSSGPITNLQLNNKSMPYQELGLPESAVEQIKTLCQKAMRVFPGLSYAGIDILLAPDTLEPRIIEINGQGDLLYQDIRNDNLIYQNQIRYYLKKTRR